MCTAPPLQDAPPGVSGSPAQDNIMLWNAVIFGPPDTIFEVDPKIYTIPFAYMQTSYFTQTIVF